MGLFKAMAGFGKEKPGKVSCAAVIVAAGKGQRMDSDLNKQFIHIYDKPILAYTLEAFEACDSIDEIVVVAREEEIFLVAELIDTYDIQKVGQVVAGGATRQDSVMCGLREVQGRYLLVAVHDGARPFILPQTIDQAVFEAEKSGACIVGVPMVDTVKRCGANGFIESTVDRNALWLVQTPQVFKTDMLIEAHKSAKAAGISLTDDAMALERLNIAVKMLEGNYDNIKVTTSADLALGETILQKRGLFA